MKEFILEVNDSVAPAHVRPVRNALRVIALLVISYSFLVNINVIDHICKQVTGQVISLQFSGTCYE